MLHVCCGSIRCTPVNSGYSGNLRSFRGFQESPGTPRGSASFREYPQVSASIRGSGRLRGLRETPRDSGNLRGTPGGSGGLRQTPRDDGDLRGFQTSRKSPMISVIHRSGNYPVIPPSGPSAAAPLVRCGAGMFDPGPVRTQYSSKNKSITGVWVRAWF